MVSAVAVRESRVSVLSKSNFDAVQKAPRDQLAAEPGAVPRSRFFNFTEDAAGWNLHVRLARAIDRLAHSHGYRDGNDGCVSMSPTRN